CSRRVPVHAPFIAVDGYELFAHLPFLRESHHSVIHTCITVRMIVTDDITHSFGGFPVPFLECVALFEHRIQYSSLHRLQTVPDIGNRAVLDHIFTVPSETVADDILQLELLNIIC